MNQNLPAAVIQSFTMQNTMFSQRKAVLHWRIVFPQFFSQRFAQQARQINNHYRGEALQRRQFATSQLYPAAVRKQQMGGVALPYELENTFNVTLNRACIVSLYTDEYQFTGGAHGMTVRTADNWNLRTGRRFALCDLFPRHRDCRQLILRQIITQIARDPSSYFDNYRELVVQNFDPRRFYLTQDAVMVYFGLYEIAPYSSGMPVFAIPYEVDPAFVICRERES